MDESLDDLTVIPLSVVDSVQVDVEDVDLLVDENLLDGQLHRAKVVRYETDTRLRIHLAYVFSVVIFLWLASVTSILFFNVNLLGLNLSDQVLIVLLSTTSVNVIGMMLIILRNLFPVSGDK